MEINDKKFNRLKTILYFFISLILAGFLIGLSSNLLEDMGDVIYRPSLEEFENQELKNELISSREVYEQKQTEYREQLRSTYAAQEFAQKQKDAEQTSFDNWLKTRTSLGKVEHDKEVLSRIKELDDLQAVVLSWQSRSDSINTLVRENNQKIEEINVTLYEQVTKPAYKAQESEYRALVVKNFLFRLLFALPILALGVYFFLKKRKSKFAPLYNGFTLFSVYVFFVGLVPYFPDFGGYVKYIVGIILTIGLASYAIKKILAYSEQRKKELVVSREERAKKLENTVVEKAFNAKVCPSCGKSILLSPWEKQEKIKVEGMLVAANYCRFCGLQVMCNCESCGERNFAHLPFCVNCGKVLKTESSIKSSENN